MSWLEGAASFISLISCFFTLLDYFVSKERIRALEEHYRPILDRLSWEIVDITLKVAFAPVGFLVCLLWIRLRTLPILLFAVVVGWPIIFYMVDGRSYWSSIQTGIDDILWPGIKYYGIFARIIIGSGIITLVMGFTGVAILRFMLYFPKGIIAAIGLPLFVVSFLYTVVGIYSLYMR